MGVDDRSAGSAPGGNGIDHEFEDWRQALRSCDPDPLSRREGGERPFERVLEKMVSVSELLGELEPRGNGSGSFAPHEHGRSYAGGRRGPLTLESLDRLLESEGGDAGAS